MRVRQQGQAAARRIAVSCSCGLVGAWLSLCWIFMLAGCADGDFSRFIEPGKVQPAAAAPVPAPAAPQQIASVAHLPVLPPPVVRPGTFKAGLLAPLTGQNAALGQAMLNAAQMAVFDGFAANFELLPRDTGDSEEGAVAALRSAAAAGATLMIGPVFAAQVAAVKPVAASMNINILALSNDAALASPGAYIVGFAPAAQVERVAHYARARGAARFAALIPDGAYGDIIAAALQSALTRNDGTLVLIGRYAPEAADLNPVMQEIAAGREQVDALLLADGGIGLRRIAAMLPAFHLTDGRIRLLGTGLWDEDNFGRRNPQLIGGWYAAPETRERNRFMDHYRSAYGAPPPRLATLSYDAVALVATLLQRGGQVDQTALTRPAGFGGVDGIFRLGIDGIAERGLAVNQVTADGALVLDPAPASFSQPAH